MQTKKDLKEAYKQMKFPAGVFQIRNTSNGKIYIDSSVNLNTIWNRHKTQLKFGSHPNEELQKDWNLLGEDCFVYEIVSETDQKDNEPTDLAKEVKQLEQLFLEELQPYNDKGYNKRKK